MSRFQKNAFLTLILLTAIAYPPLYYSIKNTVQKETLPKSYNAPSMIPKISLLPWRTSQSADVEIHLKTIHNLTSLEFEKMSGIVYLGNQTEKFNNDPVSSDIELGGRFELDPSGILFTPEILFPKSFKTYTSEKIHVTWEEIGNAPTILATTYVEMMRERIRLNRFLLLVPSYKPLSKDMNHEVLSYSEYMIYKSIFEKEISDSERLSKLNQLRLTKPNASFLSYETLRLTMKMKGVSVNKEVWKDWADRKFGDNPFSYLLLNEIGNLYYFSKEYDLAYDFFQDARKERENLGKVYHQDYAETLSKIGRILVQREKWEDALFYFTSSKEMFETLLLTDSSSFQANQVHFSLLLALLGQREVALNEFYKLESSLLVSNFSEFDRAIFFYNFARLQYSLAAYESSLHYIDLSKKILFRIGQTNHELNFYNILLLGASHFQLGEYNLAETAWEEIINAKLFLPIEDKLFYRNALLNMAYIYQKKGSPKETENYYKQYTRLTPYSAIIPLESNANPQVTSHVQLGYFDAPILNEFSIFEESVIKSYTGRYIFNGQDEEIRARTYQDRLEDTNEFLRDLLKSDFYGNQALAYLKNVLFPPIASYTKGENVIFIDIGPALNNIEAPGITSQSVAYHFSKMNVILWELPSEVELFLKKVPTDKKEELYSFPNIRIIGADGVGNFLESYFDSQRWLFRNRNIPKLEGKTIIIRAANSIDIYETYSKIQPHFKDLGKSLIENPVLYFFNRSILLKPKGSEKFSLIGYQSVRGFHHNFQSLDRNGEPPYTLAKYTLSDK